MRVLFLASVAVLALTMNNANAADDFGAPFANETPSALSDAPYVETQNPWDIAPAAGEEEPTDLDLSTIEPAAGAEEEQPADLDLPASDDALTQLRALQKEHPNLIIDDLSP